MKYTQIIILLVALVGPVSAQVGPVATPTKKNVKAEQAWLPFFSAFRSAVKQRNQRALKRMMAANFIYAFDRHDADPRRAAFAFWDEHSGRGWKAFSRTLRMGAVRTKDKGFAHTEEVVGPLRVSPPGVSQSIAIRQKPVAWYAVFEFRKDGRWYCIIFSECCD